MAEVKPARDIFKKPRTEPDSYSQNPFLAIFFFPSGILRPCQRFCLQHLENSAIACQKMQGKKEQQEKGQIAQAGSCLSLTGAYKVAEILRLSLDVEEMPISSVAFIPHVKLSPCFATPVPPPLPLPPVPLGPSGLSEA